MLAFTAALALKQIYKADNKMLEPISCCGIRNSSHIYAASICILLSAFGMFLKPICLDFVKLNWFASMVCGPRHEKICVLHICENKGADQRLSFRYIDSTILRTFKHKNA